MNIRGTLTYCNRCGFKIFRKGEISVMYGYTTWTDIEKLPEGWEVFHDEHLCPECAKAWKKVITPVKEQTHEQKSNGGSVL
jgi:uncharacterized protein YbdZ (MbtH family)